MIVIQNKTGTKVVNINTDATRTIRAFYCDVYENAQQVLDSKSFSTTKKAEKWAEKKLNW